MVCRVDVKECGQGRDHPGGDEPESKEHTEGPRKRRQQHRMTAGRLHRCHGRTGQKATRKG